MSEWISVDDRLPEDGDYNVKIKRGESIIKSKRRLSRLVWWGGCRPFTDGEIVTHWRANK